MATQRVRKDKKERKAELLEAALALAVKFGPSNVTRIMIAEKCKCSEGLVGVYLGRTGDLRKMLARETKRRGLTVPSEEQQQKISLKLWHNKAGRATPKTARKSSAGAGAAKPPATAKAKPAAKKPGAATKGGKPAKKSVAGGASAKNVAPSTPATAKPARTAAKPAAPKKAAKPKPLPPLPPPVAEAPLPPLPPAAVIK